VGKKYRKKTEPNSNVFDSGPFCGGDGGMAVMDATGESLRISALTEKTSDNLPRLP
jgi:hypothetical protein